jgi:hypothetical protein
MMRARWAILGVPAVLLAALAGGYIREYGTLNPFEPPPIVHYQGCEFHATKTVETLDEAVRFEHNASFYAKMPVRQVAKAMNGMAIYALPLGPGAYQCSAAPIDVYVEISAGQFQLYVRGGGP